MAEINNEGEFKSTSKTKQLESTIEDLTRELKSVKDELVDKEQSHTRVEKDLRTKLMEIDEAHGQKSNLLRRIEDLNHEVRTLQNEKEKKDSKLKG